MGVLEWPGVVASSMSSLWGQGIAAGVQVSVLLSVEESQVGPVTSLPSAQEGQVCGCLAPHTLGATGQAPAGIPPCWLLLRGAHTAQSSRITRQPSFLEGPSVPSTEHAQWQGHGGAPAVGVGVAGREGGL